MEKVILDKNYSKEKESKTIMIYFNEDKSSSQRIQTGKEFAGDYMSLIEHVTGSDRKRGIKNYHSFEII